MAGGAPTGLSVVSSAFFDAHPFFFDAAHGRGPPSCALQDLICPPPPTAHTERIKSSTRHAITT